MSAEFQIVPVLQTSHADPGDTIRINLYISGWGDVDSGKLTVTHDHPDIVQFDNPGKLIIAVEDEHDDNGQLIQPHAGDSHIQKQSMDRGGGIIGLVDSVFVRIPSTLHEPGLVPIIGEMKWDNNPPIRYELNTDVAAEAGDYNVTFVLTYRSNGEIKQSSKDVSIHVNSWVERNQLILQILGILGVLAAYIGLII